MFATIFAMAYKEVLQLTRSRELLRRLFLGQAMHLLVLAWLDVRVHDLPAVVVDQDRTAESRLLIERIATTHTFAFKYATSSVEQAREHIRAGRARAAIVIPPDHSRLRVAGQTAQLLALVDGSDPAGSAQAISTLRSVAARANVEAQQELVAQDLQSTVFAHEVLLFNPEGRTSRFMLPGLVAVAIALGYFLTLRRLVGERTGGHLERVLMGHASPIGLLVGQLLPWLVMGVLNIAVFLLVARLTFALPIRGSFPLLVGTSVLYMITLLALSACIAAGASTYKEAVRLSTLLIVPTYFLSGYIYPLSALPRWLLPVAYAIPHTHFIEITRGICLRGATASELGPQLAYFAVAPIVLSLLAGVRFSRTLMT
jgi:ABC-2 type transport system permease protein